MTPGHNVSERSLLTWPSQNQKAKVLGISKEKILEAYKITRYAEATRVFGNTEIVFEKLAEG